MTTAPTLTLRDVAHVLAVSRATARRLVLDGHLPNAFQIPTNKAWRVPAADVLRFLRSKQESSA